MKEPNFRAWDEVGKQWIYFDLSDALSGRVKREGFDSLRLTNRCQSTGLKDKNGEQIFESDIVKMHYFYETGSLNGASEAENEVVGTIEYRPDFAVFVVSAKGQDYPIIEYCQEPSEELEVIGDIYYSPELLS